VKYGLGQWPVIQVIAGLRDFISRDPDGNQ
jgi:hypothetical protein